MDGETGAAHRRLPLSPLSVPHLVLTRCHDGSWAVQLPCKNGTRVHSHVSIVEVLDAPGCLAVHFAPGNHYQHDGTFTPTHDVDHDDSSAIAALNARNGPSAPDEFYRRIVTKPYTGD